MKITDFALVFIAIVLPYILVLYINVTFTIKAEELEMYYQKVVESALDDAAYEMKQVESSDMQIDYGYSAKENKKINVNAQVGVDSFLDSLYDTFNISGNEAAESYLNLFIPAIAVVEYDGVRVSQNETITLADGSQSVERVLRPKRYFSYTYSIVRNGSEYVVVPGGTKNGAVSTHTIEFTMDELVIHRGYDYGLMKELPTSQFYLSDSKSNDALIEGVADSSVQDSLKSQIVSNLLDMRRDVIASVVSQELSYSVNANNAYARQAGVSYNFTFPATSDSDMYGMVDGVGIIAFMQGISVGNKYLNTKAYGMSTLDSRQRYYFTAPNNDSLIQMNLYHKDINCPEYKISKINDISPRYATSRQEAATSTASGTLNSVKKTFTGFYPCPICNP